MIFKTFGTLFPFFLFFRAGEIPPPTSGFSSNLFLLST
jgi:hypothetical protein